MAAVATVTRPAVVIACCLLTAAAGAGCRAGDRTVPPELLGVWKTAAPRFVGHYLEITPTRLIFDGGKAGRAAHDIERVDAHPEDEQMLYTFNYENLHGQEYTLSFYYTRQNGGTIRLKNRQQWEWTKEE